MRKSKIQKTDKGEMGGEGVGGGGTPERPRRSRPFGCFCCSLLVCIMYAYKCVCVYVDCVWLMCSARLGCVVNACMCAYIRAFVCWLHFALCCSLLFLCCECMCVCMCGFYISLLFSLLLVHIMYIWVCVFECVCVCMRACMHVCVFVCLSAYVCLCLCGCLSVSICGCGCGCVISSHLSLAACMHARACVARAHVHACQSVWLQENEKGCPHAMDYVHSHLYLNWCIPGGLRNTHAIVKILVILFFFLSYTHILECILHLLHTKMQINQLFRKIDW